MAELVQHHTTDVVFGEQLGQVGPPQARLDSSHFLVFQLEWSESTDADGRKECIDRLEEALLNSDSFELDDYSQGTVRVKWKRMAATEHDDCDGTHRTLHTFRTVSYYNDDLVRVISKKILVAALAATRDYLTELDAPKLVYSMVQKNLTRDPKRNTRAVRLRPPPFKRLPSKHKRASRRAVGTANRMLDQSFLLDA